MSWVVVLGLAAGAYAFKVLGLVVIGDRTLPQILERCLALIPAAMIAAIIVNNTFAVGRHLQIDARVAGVGTAVVLAWKRAPFVAIIFCGAAVTALIRALT
jgi:branched-subunit amino acid transport protein